MVILGCLSHIKVFCQNK